MRVIFALDFDFQVVYNTSMVGYAIEFIDFVRTERSIALTSQHKLSADKRPPDSFAELSRFSQPLLQWYEAHRRDFPWREQPTPYRIWVSEIMLQQTRIEAALPYFERFIAALPTVQALAEVGEERLMKLWEGLGYYSRARNLQKAAQIVMSEHNGRLPASYEKLLALPGIGEYTAGAIASMAFGLPVPAVDGNVLRVTARLLNHEGDIMSGGVKKELTGAVCSMLPHDAPGDFNQAVMELGETVCLPNTMPLCAECPLAFGCQGFASGDPSRLPTRIVNKTKRSEQRTIAVVIADGQVLLHRRSPRGLLAGMWELPGLEGWVDEESVRQWLSRLGLSAERAVIQPLPDAKHVFSHVIWQMKGWRVGIPYGAMPEGYAWVTAEDLREKAALPSAFRAYADVLQGDSTI